MFVGVGGQGTLLASRIIGNVLLNEGFDVKLSEVHGMSQRGGSVSTYVKYGEKVNSPIVDKGEADIIVAFELMESARWVSYVKEGGMMLINTQKLPPMPVITGVAEYNEDIIEKTKNLGINVIDVDALALAEQAGNAKAVNVVMMGVLSKQLGFDKAKWENAVRECAPKESLEVNLKAFELGANS
jgi:indolepyruvate ferredoxin oxidoreductase beta subunit